MFDLVTQDDAANILGVFFIFKFCRVHSDHNQLVRIFFFQLLQIGNDVHAVDAAVGPKIEQHNFAFQRRERQRLIRIQPTATAAEFRRANLFTFLYRHFETFRSMSTHICDGGNNNQRKK